jgi:hypothetical protein
MQNCCSRLPACPYRAGAMRYSPNVSEEACIAPAR